MQSGWSKKQTKEKLLESCRAEVCSLQNADVKVVKSLRMEKRLASLRFIWQYLHSGKLAGVNAKKTSEPMAPLC